MNKNNNKCNSWVIPANIKDYDIYGAFNDLTAIDWHYSNNIQNVSLGDYVYIYVSSPDCSIRYKCIVTKIKLSNLEIDDRKFNKKLKSNENGYFELTLKKKYKENLFSLVELRKHGIKNNIQGPQSLRKETLDYIESKDSIQ